MLVAVALAVLATGCDAERGRVTPPAPVATIVQDDAELLHRSTRRTAASLDELRRLGVDWVRVTAGWSVIAPSPKASRRPDFDARDPRAYPRGAWRKLDRLAAMARRRDLALAIDIAFWAPRWAVAGPRPARDGRDRDGLDVAAYADFAEAVARRYPDAVAFTVWNEPNHPVFLLPQWERGPTGAWRASAPHAYRAMVQATVPRIRRAAPDALVLIGATSSVGTERPDGPKDRMAPVTFLREMACVDTRLRPLRRRECANFEALEGDGWSHHPYSLELEPWAPDPRLANARMGDLHRLRRLLDALHARGRTRERLPLYLTEYGYQTDPPDPTWRVSAADQARWLPEAERIARATPGVRAVAQFLIRDLPERPGGDVRTRWRDYQSGLRFADGRAKPARDAFALGLVAHRSSAGRVCLWGLVRPGHGPRAARVLVRRPGSAWRLLSALRTRPDGTFSLAATVDPTAQFRLQAAGQNGPPVAGARRAPC